jgi:hypothetical protein
VGRYDTNVAKIFDDWLNSVIAKLAAFNDTAQALIVSARDQSNETLIALANDADVARQDCVDFATARPDRSGFEAWGESHRVRRSKRVESRQ